jgi:tetratricopeptide (TPR) repeat protein
MLDSKSKRREMSFSRPFATLLAALFIAAAGFLIAAGGAVAFAQTTDMDAPIRLVPLEEVSPPSETPIPDLNPEPIVEALESIKSTEFFESQPLTTVESLLPVEETSAPSDSGVEVGALAEINVDDIGLFAEESGGFPSTLWRGSRFDLLTLLLPRLPIEARSPAMRTAVLKLLLSPGEAPRQQLIAGSELEGRVVEKGVLLRLRADILAQMGEFNVAIGLLRAAPSGDFEEIIARYNSDRLFLKLDFEHACELARERIDISMDAHWQRALIFCQSIDQEFEAAGLGLDLLRESGYAPEAAFVTLINGMSGYGEAELDSMPNPSPLLVAMLRKMGIEAPRNALDAANPALLRLIAGAADSDIELRLAAAEQAEAVGALPAASVGALYSEVQFTPEERANPISQSEGMKGPLARAILYQAVMAETVPTARAEVMGIALQRAKDEARFPTMARVLLPAMQALEARSDFAWFAAQAGRAYFASGRWEEARRWYDVALAERSRNAGAELAAAALWPLIALTQQEGEIDPAMLENWWQAQGGAGDPDAYRRGGLLLTLLTSLDHNVAAEQWDVLLAGPLSAPGAVASPALHYSLRDAAAGGRLGEAVLLALLGLGAGGPGSAGLLTLGEAVAALEDVGLHRDAQAVAVEAALAGGL